MSEEWTCSKCTFINKSQLAPICEICLSERNPVESCESPEEFKATPAPHQPQPLPLLSRRELEEARLKRVAEKRKAGNDNLESSVRKKPQPNCNSGNTMAVRNRSLFFMTAITAFRKSQTPAAQLPPSVSFADILQPQILQKCFMSAFQFDLPWIATHIPANIPVCLALHNPTPNAAPKRSSNISFVFPKLSTTSQYSTMHIKLMVLYRSNQTVRIVISSANLVEYDYTQLENIVFMQDFRLCDAGRTLASTKSNDPSSSSSLSPSSSSSTSENTSLGEAFKKDLINLLKDMETDSWVWQDLANADFSSCTARLLISKPGTFTGAQTKQFGLGRLNAIAQQINTTQNPKPATLLYHTSSLGSLSTSFLNDFEAAANGALDAPRSQGSPAIKILFPTVKTVNASFLGPRGAGTITWNRKMHASCAYKHLLRDSVSKRVGALSHAKILICKNSGSSGYYYAGSHNFTMSAWGRWSLKGEKGAAVKVGRLDIGNWELGVVVEGHDGIGVVPFVEDPLIMHGEGDMSAHLL